MRRGARRDRIATGTPSPVEAFVADALLDRLDSVTRRFDRALVINTGDGAVAAALRERGTIVVETDHGRRFAAREGVTYCSEDNLPTGTAFDLVVAAAGFDTVNDLPGALVLARRALRPDGLFLGAMIGAPSLPVLRRVILELDAERDKASPRMHPLLDVRSAGDLLVRAGFALPVADLETVNLSYPDFARLLADLRVTGLTSVLGGSSSVDRRWAHDLATGFEAKAVDGRIHETASLLMLTGWSPDASQPKPAARGSAGTSLASALGALKPKR